MRILHFFTGHSSVSYVCPAFIAAMVSCSSSEAGIRVYSTSQCNIEGGLCAKDLSLPTAQHYALKALANYEACMKKRSRDTPSGKDNLYSTFRGLEPGINILVLDDFDLLMRTDISDCRPIALVTDNECGETDPTKYSWANVETVRGGQAAFAMIETLIDWNAHVDFAQWKGWIPRDQFVEISGQPEGERHYALCSSRNIDGVNGPPNNCTVVAIRSGGAKLLRSGDGRSVICGASASFRRGGTIDIYLELHTKKDIANFVEPLSNLLRQDLEFSTDIDLTKDDNDSVTSAYFVSTAGLRNSKILGGGWRESIDFNLSVHKTDYGLKAHGSTRPVVCRQASGNQTDYFSPDDNQKSIYATAYDNLLKKAFESSCAKATEVDDRALKCE